MSRAVLIAILLSASFAAPVTAQPAYPDRPVRLIVPFAPGGVTDIAARLVGQSLSKKWSQQVVIENKPGAGGVIGVETAIRSPPDGYTLLMATNGEITINPAIMAKAKYDSQRDLMPIAMVTNTPFVWSSNVNSGINSLSELVAKAKARPGELAYSSAGIGSSAHMATVQFAAAAGIKLLHVPYRGGQPAAAAIVAGDVPIASIALSSAMPILDSGKVKLLAITALKRSALVPDVPTVAETGVLKDFESSIWTGMFAPAGTPAAIVAKIETDLIAALKEPDIVERLRKAGAEPVGMPANDLKPFIARELNELKKLAAEANIHLD
jgi:tripartite-type tricarboxylate transporter receptor subunit TctC